MSVKNMVETLICPCCGRSFNPIRETQKYCSSHCQKRAAQLRYVERQKLIPKEPKEKPVLRKYCLWCGEIFETTTTQKLFCSGKCARKCWRDENKEKVRELMKKYRMKKKGDKE